MCRFALFFVALAAGSAGAFSGGWTLIDREDGIAVAEREVAGRDLPMMRAVGIIDASIYELVAVLRDSGRRREWMHRCIESRLIERLGEFESVVYNRTDAPWPLSDRDVVVKTTFYTVEPHQAYIAAFESTRSAAVPRLDDVVRMPKLEGHYRLERISERRTRVEYVINADPGGWLPRWLVKRASRELPLLTLKNLRRQLRRTRGAYDAILDRWDPSRRRAGLEAPTPPIWRGG